MADQGDIFISYDAIEGLFINSMRRRFGSGVTLDFTGARYEGDFTRGYEVAQANKRAYVLDQIELQPGDKVLDIGCGWGNMLKEIEEHGARGIGLTLSPAQQRYCNSKGWDARLRDWKDFSSLPGRRGNLEELTNRVPFDAVISIGAFEHFCSIPEFQQGKQSEIYRIFFEMVANCLEPGSRFYLQTMTFGGRGVPNIIEDDQPNAPKGSIQRIYAQWKAYFPGSIIPINLEQIVQAAQDHFRLIKNEDGRLDYVETARVWLEAMNAHGGPEKWLDWLKFLYKGRGRRQLFTRFQALREDAFSRGFAYDAIGHQRITFEKL